MTALGIRSNNPGNVSLPIQGWTGGGTIIGAPGQPGYASFPDMATGWAAFGQRMTNYIDTKGLTTIAQLNSVYATDQNWKNGVSAYSGIGLNTPLDTSNAAQMNALKTGILSQELGPANAQSVLSQVGSSGGAGAPGPLTNNPTPGQGIQPGSVGGGAGKTHRSIQTRHNPVRAWGRRFGSRAVSRQLTD